MHSLQTIQLHSLQESLGSIREIIETHSNSLSEFYSTMKSHTQHIKESVKQKANIHEHNIIKTQRMTRTMELNQALSINSMSVHGCSSYNSLLALLFLLLFDNVTMYKRGCLYPISLLRSKSIKSRIKFLSTSIKSIKCHLSTKDESYPLKVHYNIQSALH
jgi:hypothetical protein